MPIPRRLPSLRKQAHKICKSNNNNSNSYYYNNNNNTIKWDHFYRSPSTTKQDDQPSDNNTTACFTRILLPFTYRFITVSMGAKTQIVKFCFILILCLTCTLWHTLTNASETLKPRTRHLEEAKSDTTDDIVQKQAEQINGNTPQQLQSIEDTTEQNSDISKKHQNDKNNEPTGVGQPNQVKETVGEAKTVPVTPKEASETNKPAQHSGSDPPVSDQVIPSKEPTKLKPVDSTAQTVDDPDPPTTQDVQKPAEHTTKETTQASEESEEKKEEIKKVDVAEDLPETEMKTDVKANEIDNNKDFPSYTEWTKKVLEEEKNKQNDEGQASSSLPQKQKMRNNYASADCGAKVVLANPEAENSKFILNGNPDEYMINPCQAKKWFIVELCETIQVKNIETASLELFSSRPKSFRFSVSERYPTKEWQDLGTFDSSEERTIHKYQITEDNYSKWIKVDILDHYGEEHFCPLTLFRVFGFTIEEDIDIDNSNDDPDEVLEEDKVPVNLFASAKDTVLRLVKHVLTPSNEQAAKPEAATGEDKVKEKVNATAVQEDSTSMNAPNVTIPCTENCLNGTQANTTTNSTKHPCVPEASDSRPSTIAIEPSATIEQSKPAVPEGSINLMPDATVIYPDERLVTKLEDDEQVPMSDTTSSEPMVKLLESEDQPPGVNTYILQCLKCPLSKRRYKEHSDRQSLSLKCRFLKKVWEIMAIKKTSVSWKVPMTTGKFGDKMSQTFQKADPVLSSTNTLEGSENTKFVHIESSVATEIDLNASSSSKVSELTEAMSGLQPSSDVHKIIGSDKLSVEPDSEYSKSSSIGQTVLKEKSMLNTISALSSSEQNMTTSFSSELPSTGQRIVSSSKTTTFDSESNSVDFRTPATTIYIEPSSTSLKQMKLNGVTSSERYDTYLSPSDPLSVKSTPTSFSVIDGQNKEDTTSYIKSNNKVSDKETESNIITTASLSTDGDDMEPTGASIVPTRVSESPSKVVPPESASASMSVKAEDRVVKAVNVTNSNLDSKGRPLYTLVRVGLPPAGKRESAIMRLNNRIKALEMNVSLSSRFLDELSQRYRKQSEEMMHFLNRTVARLGNVTKKTEETVQRHEIHLNILESRLDNLTMAVSKLTENMDELTRQLTDRQMVWASIEVAILTLIFAACLRRRQPSLPPSLVAKVLEDLLQTQNSPHTRRRNSDSEVIQSSCHRDVVRKRSADDLVCPKSVHIVEPTTPFLLGQVKEGNRKKKKKKNKSLDLKFSNVNNNKDLLSGERSSSITQLNSAGLLFMGKPVASTLSEAAVPRESEEGRDVSSSSSSSISSSSNNNNVGTYCAGGRARDSDRGNTNMNSSTYCSRSDPDLYTAEDYVGPVALPPSWSRAIPLPPPLPSPPPLLYSAPRSPPRSLPVTPSPPSSSLLTLVAPSTHHQQCRLFPPPTGKSNIAKPNLVSYPIKQPSMNKMVAGGSGLVGTVTGENSAAFQKRFKSLDVGQKNSSDRKNLNRAQTRVHCDGFRKF